MRKKINKNSDENSDENSELRTQNLELRKGISNENSDENSELRTQIPSQIKKKNRLGHADSEGERRVGRYPHIFIF